MCGIVGFFQPYGFDDQEARQLAIKAADALEHRGPDDCGEWVDGEVGIALAHRRLSILDLTPTGHQPMMSSSGRYVLIFNGEIYNHLVIRKELDAFDKVSWRGHSDTETLLAGFDIFGIEETLKKSVGMFAFAVWDRKDRVLTLARDRMGEKPLYYGWQKNTFFFGSELKAFYSHPGFFSKVDRSVLYLYLSFGYIPAPHSIYQGIHKLLPGTFIQISQSNSGQNPTPKPYWFMPEVVQSGIDHSFAGSEEEAVDQLESLLKETIAIQRVADVPLGAFLSGGVDSSTVVALMQAQASRPVQTFTIGFHEKEYNEASYAEAIAKHLGTDHTTLYLSKNEVLEHIPQIHKLYDEPFSDASASMLVSKLARQKVKVSLSGDGGDEIFGGYERYFLLDSFWKKISKLPYFLRVIMAKTLRSIPHEILTYCLNPVLSLRGRPPSIPFGLRLHQYANVLSARNDMSMYRFMKAFAGVKHLLKTNCNTDLLIKRDARYKASFQDFQNLMMYEDALNYLADDILVKVDRSAMAVSLETRAPLLDHRIIEFSWKLPLHMKIRDGEGKWLLRQVLYRYIPKFLVDRPKMGFSLPGAEWLRGPLRSWAESLLSKHRLLEDSYFDADTVQQRLQQHMNGQYNWESLLWRLIAFQSWLYELKRL